MTAQCAAGGRTYPEEVAAGAPRVPIVGHGEGDLVGPRPREGGKEGPRYVVPQGGVGRSRGLVRGEGGVVAVHDVPQRHRGRGADVACTAIGTCI
jgi:hypothetical protein